MRSASLRPSEDGVALKVLEIPSRAYSYGSFATDSNDANAPWLSLPCIGFAPGAKGSPAWRPSGVVPVFFPYTTFEVMVRIDIVGIDAR